MENPSQTPANALSFNETIDQLEIAAQFLSSNGINLLQPHDTDVVISTLQRPEFASLRYTIQAAKERQPSIVNNYDNAINNRFGSSRRGVEMMAILRLF